MTARPSEVQAIIDWANGLARVFGSGRPIKRAEKRAWAEQAAFTRDFLAQAYPTSDGTENTAGGAIWGLSGPPGWTSPLPGMRITRGFSPSHQAIDFVPPASLPVIGHPVAAMARGSVAFSGQDARPELTQYPRFDRGIYVELDHGGGWVSRYCHLLHYPLVATGQEVDQSQVVGLLGWSGCVLPPGPAGAHCHWSVFKDGVGVDPLSLLPS